METRLKEIIHNAIVIKVSIAGPSKMMDDMGEGWDLSIVPVTISVPRAVVDLLEEGYKALGHKNLEKHTSRFLSISAIKGIYLWADALVEQAIERGELPRNCTNKDVITHFVDSFLAELQDIRREVKKN